MDMKLIEKQIDPGGFRSSGSQDFRPILSIHKTTFKFKNMQPFTIWNFMKYVTRLPKRCLEQLHRDSDLFLTCLFISSKPVTYLRTVLSVYFLQNVKRNIANLMLKNQRLHAKL